MATKSFPKLLPRQFEDCAGHSVSWGGGLDSSAILAQMVLSGFRPDSIIFAETGHEWPDTYYAVDRISDFLEQEGFVRPVRVHRHKEINVQRIEDLGEECLRSHTLPSAAYGWSKYTLKHKADVINAWLKKQVWAQQVWKTPHYYDQMPDWIVPDEDELRGWAASNNGDLAHLDPSDPKYAEILRKFRETHPYDGFKRIVKYIGYDASEDKRAKPCFGDVKEQALYEPHYPLREWGFYRKDCAAICKFVFGFVPKKSACVFCPNA